MKTILLSALLIATSFASPEKQLQDWSDTETLSFVNESDLGHLQEVKGVGAVLAARIIAARPIESKEALSAVTGIGKVLLERIEEHAAKPNR